MTMALKSIAKVLNQKVARQPKSSSSSSSTSSSSSSSDGLVQICVIFMMVFTQNSHQAVHQSIALFQV